MIIVQTELTLYIIGINTYKCHYCHMYLLIYRRVAYILAILSVQYVYECISVFM